MSRELDGQLAETVFGYTRKRVPPGGSGEHGGGEMLVPPGGMPHGFELHPKGPIALHFMAPSFTDRVSGCFELVGILNRAQVEVVIGCFPPNAGRGYSVDLRRWVDQIRRRLGDRAGSGDLRGRVWRRLAHGAGPGGTPKRAEVELVMSDPPLSLVSLSLKEPRDCPGRKEFK